jgi:hypothetical protein
MTVIRRELPPSDIAGPGADALSHKSVEGSPFVGPLTRCSRSSVIASRFGLHRLLDHQRPEEAAPFACDGDHGDLRPLASADPSGVALVQALLGLLGLRDDPGRLASEEAPGACSGGRYGWACWAPTGSRAKVQSA